MLVFSWQLYGWPLHHASTHCHSARSPFSSASSLARSNSSPSLSDLTSKSALPTPHLPSHCKTTHGHHPSTGAHRRVPVQLPMSCCPALPALTQITHPSAKTGRACHRDRVRAGTRPRRSIEIARPCWPPPQRLAGLINKVRTGHSGAGLPGHVESSGGGGQDRSAGNSHRTGYRES